jgi:hypothetical protein
MSLLEYLAHLGWSLTDLCRHADIEMHTARRAVRDNITSARTAQKLAEALSKAMGQDIKPGNIQGLLIRN